MFNKRESSDFTYSYEADPTRGDWGASPDERAAAAAATRPAPSPEPEPVAEPEPAAEPATAAAAEEMRELLGS